MKFQQEFIDRVVEANNLVEIVGQYTQLKAVGGGYMGRCPLPGHNERTPSFSVSEVKQVYNCFGCGRKGNLIGFLRDIKGTSFTESIEFLADRAGIELPQALSRQDQQQAELERSRRREMLKVNQLAKEYFQKQLADLPARHWVSEYVRSRKLLPETLAEFAIGYTGEGSNGLVQYLKQKGVSLNTALSAKLIRESQDSDGHYDFFRSRLVFPVQTTLGEVVAFGGRVLGEGEPKYLNTPETPVFSKSRVLYGLSSTARFIRGEDAALVVEGYMDLVSLFQSGIKNAVAPMGTALTSDQAVLIRRMTQNVVVLFDGDVAGISAAERSLPILLSQGLHPRGLILPDQLDPDEYVQEFGGDSLQKKIQEAPDLFGMVLQSWLGPHGARDPSRKVQIVDQLKPVFAEIRDSRLRTLYMEQAARFLRVENSWLLQALKGTQGAALSKSPTLSAAPSERSSNRVISADSSVPGAASAQSIGGLADAGKLQGDGEDSQAPAQIELKGISRAEQSVVSLALSYSPLLDELAQTESIQNLPHPGARQVLEMALRIYRQAPDRFDKLVGLLSSYVDQPGLLFASRLDELPIEAKEAKLPDEEPQGGIPKPEMTRSLVTKAAPDALVWKQFRDGLWKVRVDGLKLEADRLAAEIQQDPSPEKMNLYLEITKVRKTLLQGKRDDQTKLNEI